MRLLSVLLIALTWASPVLAASKTVRDWTGTCDEYSCVAEVTGAGGLAMGGQGYRLQIARASDPSSGWGVTLIAARVPQPDGKSAVNFTIPGFDLPPTQLAPAGDGERFDVSDQPSLEKIFPALRRGSAVEIAFTSADGPAKESFSLSGIAAVLLWIDDQQKRVGNSDQVQATASSATTGEVTGDDARALMKEVAGLSIAYDCQWNGPEAQEGSFYAQSFKLDDDHQLYLVQCMMGAYQPSTLVFLKSFDRLEPLAFADYSTEMGWGGTLYLGFVDFDPKSQELSNFVKARGLGDCGASANYKWTGYLFKLLEFRYRDCTDDPPADPDAEIPEFPIIYKAK